MEKPRAEILGKNLRITRLDGQNNAHIQVFTGEGKVATEELEFVLTGGVGTTNEIDIKKLKWSSPHPVKGEKYIVSVGVSNETDIEGPVRLDWMIGSKSPKPTTPPTEGSVLESAPLKVEIPRVETTPPVPTKQSAPVPEQKEPSDTDLILTAVSERLDVIEVTQRLWNEKLQHQTFKPKDVPAIPTWIAEMEAALTEIRLILLSQSDPKFNQAQTKANECSMWLVEFKKKVGQLQAPTKPATVPTPAPAAPIPTPAPTPAPSPKTDLLSGKVEGLETRLEGLEVEVGNVKNQVTKVNDQVTGLDSVFKTGIANLTKDLVKGLNEALAGLKTSPSPATTAVAPTPATPTTQPVLPATPPSSGGGGSGTGDNGGQQTSAKPKPEKNWLIWFVLLAGILGTILLFLGIGGWIRSAFLEGVLLGNKGTPTSMMVPATATTNATPAQAMAPPVTTPQAPTLTQAELEAFAAKHLAMQTEHNKAIEKMVGLAATTPTPATTTPTTAHQTAETKAGVTINSNGNNIVAGRDVTVINNYNRSFPTSSGDKNGSVETPQSSKPVTMGGVVPQWSPTLMSGYICVPVAADGSGSEGYWIYGILTTVRGV